MRLRFITLYAHHHHHYYWGLTIGLGRISSCDIRVNYFGGFYIRKRLKLASLRYSPPVRFVRECLNHILIAFSISDASNLSNINLSRIFRYIVFRLCLKKSLAIGLEAIQLLET